MRPPSRDAIRRALHDAPAPVAALVATGRVAVVPLGSEPATGMRLASASPFRDGLPGALVFDGITATVALASVRHLGRNLVRAAYLLAPDEARADALRAVASEGENLVWAARDRVRSGVAHVGEHRDLRWCASPAAWLSDDGPAHVERLSTFLDLYPTPETLALGSWEGLDGRDAVCGAVYAHYAVRAGRLDAGSDVAREAVAHRHARCPWLLPELFASAALACGHEPAPRP